MLMFVAGAACGTGVGLLRGGRLGRLAELRLRAPLLVATALLLQAGAGLLPANRRLASVALSYVLVGGWLVANAAGRPAPLRRAVGLLAAGWLLNVVPMAANGGMPVSTHALERAGVPHMDVEDGHLFKHVPASAATVAPWLGNVIPVRAVRGVVSVGDIAMLAGVALFVASGMGPGRTGGNRTRVTRAPTAAALSGGRHPGIS